MQNIDYQAIIDLKNSNWWKMLVEELDQRIKNIEDVLMKPTTDDMFWGDEIKILNLLNYKKAERVYLIWLKELPQEILDTKINTNNNKKI
jgi:hypothetical protein